MEDTLFLKILIVVALILILIMIRKSVIEMFKIRGCSGISFTHCNLDECAYDEECEDIGTRNIASDFDLEYKNNLRNYHIEQDKRIVEIYNVNYNTPKPEHKLHLYNFNGINSYCYLPKFYGTSISVSMFLKFNKQLKQTTPLFSSRQIVGNLVYNELAELYNIEIIVNDQSTLLFEDSGISINELNYISVVITKGYVSLLVLNTHNTNNDVNVEVLTNEDITTDSIISPHILIGTNNKRTDFFSGYIGKLRISREIYSMDKAKIDSGFYPKTYGEIPVNVFSIAGDTTKPNKLTLVGQYNGSNITLYWTRPSVGYNTLQKYILLIKQGDIPYKFVFIPNKNCEKCYYKLTDIIKNTEYRFGIFAENNEGRSEISKIISLTPKSISNSNINIKSKTPKISCNPDGTYNISNSCYKEPSLIIDVDNTKNKTLKDYLGEVSIKNIIGIF